MIYRYEKANKFYEQLSNNKDGKKVILVDNYQKSVEK